MRQSWVVPVLICGLRAPVSWSARCLTERASRWPELPPQYYTQLMAAYGRQTRMPPSYKRAIPALQVCPREMGAWALTRFKLWAEERHLLGHFDFSAARLAETAAGHYSKGYAAVARPWSWRIPLTNAGSPTCFEDPMVVYHGTYPELLARTLTEGHLKPSGRPGLGGDCRKFPGVAVYTADTHQHALSYAVPSVFTQDNVFCSVCYEAVGDRCRRLEARNGEQLFPQDAVVLTALHFAFNIAIPKGSWRSSVPLDHLELLPARLAQQRGTRLRPVPLRPTPWY